MRIKEKKKPRSWREHGVIFEAHTGNEVRVQTAVHVGKIVEKLTDDEIDPANGYWRADIRWVAE